MKPEQSNGFANRPSEVTVSINVSQCNVKQIIRVLDRNEYRILSLVISVLFLNLERNISGQANT